MFLFAVIYNSVLKANRAVIDSLKPGVWWVAMHKLANKIVLEDLVKAGILQGDVDEMMKVITKSCNNPMLQILITFYSK